MGFEVSGPGVASLRLGSVVLGLGSALPRLGEQVLGLDPRSPAAQVTRLRGFEARLRGFGLKTTRTNHAKRRNPRTQHEESEQLHTKGPAAATKTRAKHELFAFPSYFAWVLAIWLGRAPAKKTG